MNITGIYTCPSCQLPITFRCDATNLITCSHCHTAIERLNSGLLKQRSDLPLVKDDRTPIQIGARGEWNGRKFQIIGRLRCVFVEEYANNWTMYFDDGDIMTLVEGYGQFAVYEKAQLEKYVSFSKVAALDYSSGTVELNEGKNYILERQNICNSIEAEGENWLFDEDGKFTSVEVAATGGGRYELLSINKTDFLCFRIHYLPLADFKFDQLRTLQSGVVTKEFSCPKCNSAIPSYSWPMAQSFTCSNCGACYFYEKGNLKYRTTIQTGKKPAIPLYTKGVLRGTEYQVVGFMEKRDAESYKWREYTLFNPVEGYAFLSEYNGHWIFVKETADAPVIISKSRTGFFHDDKEFLLYSEYTFSVVDSQGEFPGNSFDNNKVECREYIAPPEMWVREIYSSGLYWFHGGHISNRELYNAFEKISLPYKVGIGSVQPVRGQVSTGILRGSILAVAFGFILLFLISLFSYRQQLIFENTFNLPDSTHIPPVITQKFKLDKWRSNLEIDISAPVENNWFEADMTLVNADNGNEYSIVKGVEYYSGYEDGEYWTEGDQNEDALLESVPAGNYFLKIYPSRGSTSLMNFSLKVIYDVPMWRNFFIFVLLALAPAIALYIIILYREALRWQNSSFSNN